MSIYAGIESVDPTALRAQYALTEALWSKLVEQGLRERSQGRIEAFFFAEHESAAASLTCNFPDAHGWSHDVSPTEGRVRIRVVTPKAELTRDAFLELVDVMMVAAHEHGCVFDGFQLNLGAVRKAPWWRLW